MKLGKLTDRHLGKLNACLYQRNEFRRLFPDGFVPTYDNFVKAGIFGLNVSWAASRILPTNLVHIIDNEVQYRRWGYRKLWTVETYQQSYAIIWWQLIQQQVDILT